MKSESVTTYMLVPLLMWIISMGAVTHYLVKEIGKINKGLIAYADCSEEIMNSAFLGKFENFSTCYARKLNTTTFNCIQKGDTIICKINNESYTFRINQ